jgi:diguanylate cyclase (GGDEF)-like protein
MTTDLVTLKSTELLPLAGIKSFDKNTYKTRINGGTGKFSRSGHDERISSEIDDDSSELLINQRMMNATFALLKKAQIMLDRAEEKIAIQETRLVYLEELATTDELTGLKNRRGFLETFIRELDRCDRGQSCGGLLVLIDLDNFKNVNDQFGHLAGDACLRLVGRTLQSEVRKMDVAARLGGDEFVLLLSNTTKHSAARRAQELAWRLNNLSMAWYGEEIPVQASLGLKDYSSGDCVDSVFNDADMRLYSNKKMKEANCHK